MKVQSYETLIFEDFNGKVLVLWTFEVFNIEQNFRSRSSALKVNPDKGIIIKWCIALNVYCFKTGEERNPLEKKIVMKDGMAVFFATFAIVNANQTISPPVAESPVWIGSSRFLFKITVTTYHNRTRHFHWLVGRALPKHALYLARLSLSIYFIVRCPSLFILSRLNWN